MSCEEFQEMLSAYVDDELAPEQQRRVEEHLAGCTTCRQERAALVGLKEDLAMIRFQEPSDQELAKYWAGIYNRLERAAGWCLLSLGLIVLLCYGAFKLIEDFVANSGVALGLKIGVVAVIFGGLILLVSLLRERLTVRKVDRYSKEIDR